MQLQFATINEACQHLANLTGKRIMIASDYEINHKTYSQAVQEAQAYAEKEGYEVDEDSWFHEISTGPGKPKNNETVTHVVDLKKDGEETKHTLQIQVYDKGNGLYELNTYIGR
jgi:hypothetical protein